MRTIMKDTEIKRNIFNIATDVFRDTQVLFAYLYGSYAVDQAHPLSDLDWKMVSIEKMSRKFVYEFIKSDVEDIREFRKSIMQQYGLI